MNNKWKRIILLAIVPFFAGILVVSGWNEKTAKAEGDTTTGSTLKPFGQSKKSQPLLESEAGYYSTFAARVQKSLTAEECSKLFDELRSSKDNLLSSFAFNAQMKLLMKKWGKVAPRQALEKIKSTGSNRELMLPVFQGWAENDPETAAAFFNESKDSAVKLSFLVPFGIASEWAKHSPQQAWDWLESQKGKSIFGDNYQFSRDSIIGSMAEKHPEQIASFIDRMTEKDFEKNAYTLGEQSAGISVGVPEWFEKLPEKAKIKAEAGRLMALTGGDLESVKTQFSALDKEKQKVMMNELAPRLLNQSRLDMQERVDWIMDMTLDRANPPGIEYAINKWMLEDWADSKKWLDSIPPGKKKERLLEFSTYHTHYGQK